MWFQEQKFQNKNPFWSLVNFVSRNNSVHILNTANGAIDDYVGYEYNEQQESIEDTEEDDSDTKDSGSETDDSESDILSYSCPYCMAVFFMKNQVTNHLNICDEI